MDLTLLCYCAHLASTSTVPEPKAEAEPNLGRRGMPERRARRLPAMACLSGAGALVTRVGRLPPGHSCAGRARCSTRPLAQRRSRRAGQGELGKGRRADGRGGGAEVPPCPCSLRASTRPRLHKIGSLRIGSGRLQPGIAANWERPPAARNRRELVFTLVG